MRKSKFSPEVRERAVRMLLCLAYEDSRELESMSFFEDLMAKYHSITAP